VPRPRGEGMVVVEGPVAWRIKGEIMIMFDGQENSLDNHSLGLPPAVVRPREGLGGLATEWGGGVVNEVRRPWEVRVLPVAVGTQPLLPLFFILLFIQVTNWNICPQLSIKVQTAPLSLASFSFSLRMLAGVGYCEVGKYLSKRSPRRIFFSLDRSSKATHSSGESGNVTDERKNARTLTDGVFLGVWHALQHIIHSMEFKPF